MFEYVYQLPPDRPFHNFQSCERVGRAFGEEFVLY